MKGTEGERRTTGITVIMLAIAVSTISSRIGTALAAPLRIVTTTSILADTVTNSGADPSSVTALIGAGVDPHLYKASPGDLRILTSADLILHHGLHLEGKLADVLESLSKRKRVVAVSTGIPPELLRRSAAAGDAVDPHVWLDPSLWRYTITVVRDSLVALDPEHVARYNREANRFTHELKEIDTWTKEQIASIPPTQRVLITAHDAFGYFGAAYGVSVQGIQGISTDSEASLREVTQIIDRIVTQRIPAVFMESSVSQKGIQALLEGARARGYAVKLGGELLSDSLGAPGTLGDTYLGMLRHNVAEITEALRQEIPNHPPQDHKQE